jgi:hypothetical protein
MTPDDGTCYRKAMASAKPQMAARARLSSAEKVAANK